MAKVMNLLDKIFRIVLIVICLGFMLYVLWALTWGPLKECPFHPKDPNTSECIVAKP